MSESLDTVQRVLDLMKATFGEAGPDGVFRTYYDGDPDEIPVFNLPALIVTQTGDETVDGGSGQDDVTDKLTIKVVLNKADDYTGNSVDPLDMTERKIRELIGKADPETRNYEPQTVKYALRNDLLEGFTAVSSDFSVEYGINPRPSGNGLADLTSEGHVNFSIQFTLDTEQFAIAKAFGLSHFMDMTKKIEEITEESEPKKYFIVPGYGHIEAEDISQIPDKLKALKEQKETE